MVSMICSSNQRAEMMQNPDAVSARSLMSAQIPAPGGLKRSLADLIVRLAKTQHDGRLRVDACGFGFPQHVQRLHVACARVAYAPLQQATDIYRVHRLE